MRIPARNLRPRHAVVLYAVAIGVALAAFVVYDLQREQAAAVEAAVVRTQNLARVLEENARQSLRRVELLMARAAEALKDESDPARDPAGLRERLRAILPADGLIRALSLVNRDGETILTTLVADDRSLPNVADRDYFAAQRERAGLGMVIGAALKSSLTDAWTLPMSVRRDAPGGAFQGVLVASVEPAYFQDFYNSIDTGANGFVTLFQREGWIVARSPFDARVLNRNWADSPMFRVHLPAADAGTVRQVVVADGIERVYSYRALKDYPVIVSLGLSLTDILAPWRARAWRDGILLLIVLAALAGAARALTRQLEQRELAERSLRHAKQRLEIALEGSQVSVWESDLRTNEVWLDGGWAKYLGNPPSETRTTAVELLTLVHPEDREPVAAAAVQVTKGEIEHYAVEHRVMTQGGAWKWILSRGRVVARDAAGRALRMSGTNADIAEHKQAEEALRAGEARFRANFELSQEGTAVHRDGTVVLANAAMARLLGAAGSEALAGSRIEDWFLPPYRGPMTVRCAALAAAPGQVGYAESQLLRLDGARLAVEYAAGSYLEQGRLHTQMVFRDISERKEIERRMLALNVTLERRVAERTAELAEANRELEAFSYSVSHDLRAPLGAVNGFAHLARQQEGQRLSEDGRRLLDQVQQNAARMSELIEGLLELSRLGRGKLTRIGLRPEELVREVIEGNEAAGRAAILVGALPACRGDPVLLRQVWTNLIGNALKYSRGCAQPEIRIGFDEPAKAYFVRDNGVGFDMRHSAKLFGVFERLHGESEFEGHGVGLAIVERIVRRHGGRVWAEAEPGKGATFRFSVAAD